MFGKRQLNQDHRIRLQLVKIWMFLFVFLSMTGESLGLGWDFGWEGVIKLTPSGVRQRRYGERKRKRKRERERLLGSGPHMHVSLTL